MLTASRLIHRIFCDHKGTALTLTAFKNLWTMEILNEETKCIRCGIILKRSQQSIAKRKRILKIMFDLTVFLIVSILIAFYIFISFYFKKLTT